MWQPRACEARGEVQVQLVVDRRSRLGDVDEQPEPARGRDEGGIDCADTTDQRALERPPVRELDGAIEIDENPFLVGSNVAPSSI